MPLAVFLLTDIVGSTSTWAAPQARSRQALARHDEILRDAIAAAGGSLFKHTGDGCAAVFGSTVDAMNAAAQAQRCLGAADWGETGELAVRIGIHAGEAGERDGDWFGKPLNRCARLTAIAHGGQVLSSAAHALLQEDPAPFGLRDLGVHRLCDSLNPSASGS